MNDLINVEFTCFLGVLEITPASQLAIFLLSEVLSGQLNRWRCAGDNVLFSAGLLDDLNVLLDVLKLDGLALLALNVGLNLFQNHLAIVLVSGWRLQLVSMML